MTGAPSPIECFLQLFEAWKAKDWERMEALAQPSWKQGIRDAPIEQEKILVRRIKNRGFKPLPLTGLDPRTELKRLRKRIKDRKVGIPKDQIRGMFDSIEPIEHPVDPRTKEIHLTGLKKGEVQIDKDRMIDVLAQVKIRLIGARDISVRKLRMTVRVMDEGGGWTYNPVSILRRMK